MILSPQNNKQLLQLHYNRTQYTVILVINLTYTTIIGIRYQHFCVFTIYLLFFKQISLSKSTLSNIYVLSIRILPERKNKEKSIYSKDYPNLKRTISDYQNINKRSKRILQIQINVLHECSFFEH